MLRAERAEIFLVCTPIIVTFWALWGTLVVNKVKIFSHEFVWGGKTAVWGNCTRAPSYVTGKVYPHNVTSGVQTILFCIPF